MPAVISRSIVLSEFFGQWKDDYEDTSLERDDNEDRDADSPSQSLSHTRSRNTDDDPAAPSPEIALDEPWLIPVVAKRTSRLLQQWQIEQYATPPPSPLRANTGDQGAGDGAAPGVDAKRGRSRNGREPAAADSPVADNIFVTFDPVPAAGDIRRKHSAPTNMHTGEPDTPLPHVIHRAATLDPERFRRDETPDQAPFDGTLPRRLDRGTIRRIRTNPDLAAREEVLNVSNADLVSAPLVGPYMVNGSMPVLQSPGDGLRRGATFSSRETTAIRPTEIAPYGSFPRRAKIVAEPEAMENPRDAPVAHWNGGRSQEPSGVVRDLSFRSREKKETDAPASFDGTLPRRIDRGTIRRIRTNPDLAAREEALNFSNANLVTTAVAAPPLLDQGSTPGPGGLRRDGTFSSRGTSASNSDEPGPLLRRGKTVAEPEAIENPRDPAVAPWNVAKTEEPSGVMRTLSRRKKEKKEVEAQASFDGPLPRRLDPGTIRRIRTNPDLTGREEALKISNAELVTTPAMLDHASAFVQQGPGGLRRGATFSSRGTPAIGLGETGPHGSLPRRAKIVAEPEPIENPRDPPVAPWNVGKTEEPSGVMRSLSFRSRAKKAPKEREAPASFDGTLPRRIDRGTIRRIRTNPDLAARDEVLNVSNAELVTTPVLESLDSAPVLGPLPVMGPLLTTDATPVLDMQQAGGTRRGTTVGSRGNPSGSVDRPSSVPRRAKTVSERDPAEAPWNVGRSEEPSTAVKLVRNLSLRSRAEKEKKELEAPEATPAAEPLPRSNSIVRNLSRRRRREAQSPVPPPALDISGPIPLEAASANPTAVAPPPPSWTADGAPPTASPAAEPSPPPPILARGQPPNIVYITDPETGSTRSIKTRAFVIAAGPHLKQIGKMIGVDFPVVNELHSRITVEDPQGVIAQSNVGGSLPFTIWADNVKLSWTESEKEAIRNAKCRPEVDLTEEIEVKGIAGAHLRPLTPTESPTRSFTAIWTYDSETFTDPVYPTPSDPLYPDVVLRGLLPLFPSLAALLPPNPPPNVTLKSGYYCKTANNTPILGALPFTGGFVCAGVSGFGVMCSQAAGETVAAEVGAYLQGRVVAPTYGGVFEFGSERGSGFALLRITSHAADKSGLAPRQIPSSLRQDVDLKTLRRSDVGPEERLLSHGDKEHLGALDFVAQGLQRSFWAPHSHRGTESIRGMAPHCPTSWSADWAPADAFAAPEDGGFLNFSVRVGDDPSDVAASTQTAAPEPSTSLNDTPDPLKYATARVEYTSWTSMSEASGQGPRRPPENVTRSSWTGGLTDALRQLTAYRWVLTRDDDPDSDSDDEGEEAEGEEADMLKGDEELPKSAEIQFWYNPKRVVTSSSPPLETSGKEHLQNDYFEITNNKGFVYPILGLPATEVNIAMIAGDERRPGEWGSATANTVRGRGKLQMSGESILREGARYPDAKTLRHGPYPNPSTTARRRAHPSHPPTPTPTHSAIFPASPAASTQTAQSSSSLTPINCPSASFHPNLRTATSDPIFFAILSPRARSVVVRDSLMTRMCAASMMTLMVRKWDARSVREVGAVSVCERKRAERRLKGVEVAAGGRRAAAV
ncbi:hypothetical protein BDK51DRAFT_52275 [Blyttiomyces helicus]|uniref:Uncharacterized protein n=1 Tax=Blyttiomyces helicus TaxID=388810 RepID=A0A4P9WCN2_9FUNG|nr:hypothetical protein BDK51DRAFT_52275 [Blyttiomyces helicus]|eukprot:RKO90274.1 hypothetical protein BDK51DRAFT_52275 [Blyttiomyces helicus]